MSKYRALQETPQPSRLFRSKSVQEDRSLLQKAIALLLTVLLFNSITVSVIVHLRGVSDDELYQWWDTICNGHTMVYFNAQSVTPPYEADDVKAALERQQELFKITADTLESLPFRYPTQRQEEGYNMVLEALSTAQEELRALPISTLRNPSQESLKTAAQQLKLVYENYVSQLSQGIDKVGAGSTKNIAAIRRLPQCAAFL
ncbi:MAG TPA: hypothetical protein GX530_06260 [Corynebacteriales bacterium]|nr:hypothetical protein [Mycobacteriales bacterium]